MRDHLVGEGRLFEPTVMLPSQYFGLRRRGVPLRPEFRLVTAMFEDAIDCFRKHLFARDERGRSLFADSEAWIASDDRAWPFSFENVCDLLGMNPEYVRARLYAWKERQLAQAYVTGAGEPRFAQAG